LHDNVHNMDLIGPLKYVLGSCIGSLRNQIPFAGYIYHRRY
jgi:hypothetical protein